MWLYNEITNYFCTASYKKHTVQKVTMLANNVTS